MKKLGANSPDSGIISPGDESSKGGDDHQPDRACPERSRRQAHRRHALRPAVVRIVGSSRRAGGLRDVCRQRGVNVQSSKGIKYTELLPRRLRNTLHLIDSRASQPKPSTRPVYAKHSGKGHDRRDSEPLGRPGPSQCGGFSAKLAEEARWPWTAGDRTALKLNQPVRLSRHRRERLPAQTRAA
jgi:hypothetical protein